MQHLQDKDCTQLEDFKVRTLSIQRFLATQMFIGIGCTIGDWYPMGDSRTQIQYPRVELIKSSRRSIDTYRLGLWRQIVQQQVINY